MSEKILLKESTFKEFENVVRKRIQQISKSKKINLIHDDDREIDILNKIMIRWFDKYCNSKTNIKRNEIINAINYDIGKEINSLIADFRKNNKIKNKKAKELELSNLEGSSIDNIFLKEKYNKIFKYIDDNYKELFKDKKEYELFKKYIHLVENNNNTSNIKEILKINTRTIEKYKKVISKVKIII